MTSNQKLFLSICVNYRNEDETVDFADDVDRQRLAEQGDLYIVDNSGYSHESRLDGLTMKRCGLRVLRPESNLGFYPGAAWALKEYLKENRVFPEWIMVSNTDMRIPGESFFAEVSTLYSKDPPAVIAPSIRSTFTGADQNPQIPKRPSRRQWRFYLVIFRFYPLFLAYNALSVVKNLLKGRSRKPVSQEHAAEVRQIYAPHGSCVLFNRTYFEAGASIEHGAFLFGETITVAEWARRKGLRIVYDPRIEIQHKEHSTTGRIKSRRIARLQYLAARYCWGAYFKSG